MQLVVSCLLLALVAGDTLPMAMVWDDVLPPYLLPILVREAIKMKDFPNYVRTLLLLRLPAAVLPVSSSLLLPFTRKQQCSAHEQNLALRPSTHLS